MKDEQIAERIERVAHDFEECLRKSIDKQVRSWLGRIYDEDTNRGSQISHEEVMVDASRTLVSWLRSRSGN